MPRRKVPERDVKRMISRYLDALPGCYYRMHVPTGWGRSGLDYEGCVRGLWFSIEAKSPDEDADLTAREREVALEVLAAGGKVFVVSCHEGLRAFIAWVDRCCRT